CNSVDSTAADERTGRILSSDNTVRGLGGLVASAAPLDVRDGLIDSREGPWEVVTPRSSCPGADCTPLRGANLRLIAKSTLKHKPSNVFHNQKCQNSCGRVSQKAQYG